MAYLALDLSKRSSGWAWWAPGHDLPVCGTWELGSEITSPGRVFLRLHQHLNDIHTVTPLDAVTYEQPLNLGAASKFTNADSDRLLVGLAAHVQSYCEAKGIRHCRPVSQVTWRKHFLPAFKRGTRTPDLKQMAMDACRALGIEPRRHDAAEAVGILDHALFLAGVEVPWRAAAAGELFEAGRAVA